MNRPLIPHNAFIFVGDGRKALFLRNEGDERFPNFMTERVFVDRNPATHEQGADEPGRRFAQAGGVRRSAMETTDWHELEEHRFAQRVAEALEELVRTRGATGLVIVAPPRTLADLRSAMHADVRALVISEINKDLTKHPIWEIEKHVTGELQAK